MEPILTQASPVSLGQDLLSQSPRFLAVKLKLIIVLLPHKAVEGSRRCMWSS